MRKLAITTIALLFLLTSCGKHSFSDVVESVENASSTAELSATTSAEPTDTNVGEQHTVSATSMQHIFAYAAFQKALRTIHDELLWPGVVDAERIEPYGSIEEERFAIFDVDGDGEEELLISVSNTYIAGMCEIIYGYDPQSDSVRVEAQNYVAVTHYPGMLMVDASHSHGYAGDILWPYSILYYDKIKDCYQKVYNVDAWCKAISDYDNSTQMPYPENVDTECDGYVFLITENGETKYMNRSDYQEWKSALLAGKVPLTIPWQKLSNENIESLSGN